MLALSGAVVPGEGALGGLLAFSQAQPILWPSLALVIATGVAVLMFPALRRNTVGLLGQGADDSIMPLLNTAAVIGFGGVVTQTAGFAQFAQWIPVSYTHLDVYKRQAHPGRRCGSATARRPRPRW